MYVITHRRIAQTQNKKKNYNKNRASFHLHLLMMKRVRVDQTNIDLSLHWLYGYYIMLSLSSYTQNHKHDKHITRHTRPSQQTQTAITWNRRVWCDFCHLSLFWRRHNVFFIFGHNEEQRYSFKDRKTPMGWAISNVTSKRWRILVFCT